MEVSSNDVIQLDSDDEGSGNRRLEPILEYPPKTEGEESLGSIEIYEQDLICLLPKRFLNDKIIDFWMNYYLAERVGQDRERVVVISSLFYNSIQYQYKKQLRRDQLDKYEPSRWAKQLDNMFEKELIFIPIPIHAHWVLAVICNPGSIVKLRKKAPCPMIMIFDSLKNTVDLEKICKSLRMVLSMEWKRQKGSFLEWDDFTVPCFVPVVSQQNNYYDCGIFLLEFFESFFKIPNCLDQVQSLVPSNKANLIHFQELLPNSESYPDKRLQIFETVKQMVLKYDYYWANLPIITNLEPKIKNLWTHLYEREEKNLVRNEPISLVGNNYETTSIYFTKDLSTPNEPIVPSPSHRPTKNTKNVRKEVHKDKYKDPFPTPASTLRKFNPPKRKTDERSKNFTRRKLNYSLDSETNSPVQIQSESVARLFYYPELND